MHRQVCAEKLANRDNSFSIFMMICDCAIQMIFGATWVVSARQINSSKFLCIIVDIYLGFDEDMSQLVRPVCLYYLWRIFVIFVILCHFSKSRKSYRGPHSLPITWRGDPRARLHNASSALSKEERPHFPVCRDFRYPGNNMGQMPVSSFAVLFNFTHYGAEGFHRCAVTMALSALIAYNCFRFPSRSLLRARLLRGFWAMRTRGTLAEQFTCLGAKEFFKIYLAKIDMRRVERILYFFLQFCLS